MSGHTPKPEDKCPKCGASKPVEQKMCWPCFDRIHPGNPGEEIRKQSSGACEIKKETT